MMQLREEVATNLSANDVYSIFFCCFSQRSNPYSLFFSHG